MSHLDQENIALLAIGEQANTADQEHLRHCRVCQEEIDKLRTVVQIARSGELKEDEYDAVPPPQVWDRIIADIDPVAAAEQSATPPSALPRPRLPLRSADLQAPPPYARLHGRSSRRAATWKVVVGCVAAAVAGVLVTLGITRPWQDTAPPTAASVQVAEANLSPLQAGSSAGASVVVERVNGQVVVVVRATGLPLSSGYYEVWLFDPSDPVKMQSLGALVDGADSRFTLPKGFDLDTFSSVDISAEDFDGDPNHSATSVLRGTLTS